jgi:hypothetical protein
MRPARLMMPGVREKLTIRGPRGVTLWNSKSVPYFIVQEQDSCDAVAACYLSEDDCDCKTHMSVFPLLSRTHELDPVVVDCQSGTARKVAISTLALVPIRGVVGEHGVLVAPKCEKSLGNLVVVVSAEDEWVEIRRKGSNKPLKEFFSVSSIAMCAMSSSTRTK